MLWKTASAVAAVVMLAVLISYFGVQRGSGPISAPRRETAMLDLRTASTPRSVQPTGAKGNEPLIELPRAVVSMTIQLPIGSEAGPYEVQILKSGQAVTAAATGQANIEGGVTRLMVDIDTTAVPSGEYQLAWRMYNFDWLFSPILVR